MAQELITRRFEESLAVTRRFVQMNEPQIENLVSTLITAFQADHKVLLFGNGGSATDAAHLAAELVGRYQKERRPLPVLALTTNSATLTSIANDYDFTDVFARQILAHGRPGDVAIAISTSGNSANVLRGVEAARSQNLVTVGWSGQSGGKLAGMVDQALLVPSTNTARIQECLLILGHIVCELVEEKFFGKTP